MHLLHWRLLNYLPVLPMLNKELQETAEKRNQHTLWAVNVWLSYIYIYIYVYLLTVQCRIPLSGLPARLEQRLGHAACDMLTILQLPR